MGITGLIPILKSIHAKVHIREYSGQSIAVDGYVWLHRGVFSCAMELAMGKPTDKYIQYFMHYIRMLKFNKIDPIIVFDGGKLPSKRHTEEDRHTKREEYRAKGMEYLRVGERKKAFECFQKCVDVTPEMAYQVIKQLKKENVKYVVAPYEADGQLAYLMKSGKVTAVITEDSDMIVFGCKTIIFKLDKYGEGIEVNLDRLSSVSDINLKGWTTSDIRQMCILSGCDYLPSLSGMGLKTAHKLLQKYKTADKVIQFIRFEGKIPVPADYELDFNRAEFTFLYQRVYDVDSGEMIHLTPLPESLDTNDMSFLGEKLDKETATKVAQGILHPCTRKPIVDIQSNSRYDNKENIPPRSNILSTSNGENTSHALGNQKSIANYFAKPSTASQTQSQMSSARLVKSNSQQPLVRRDSSFMGSVMLDLSISSQSSDSSTPAMSATHDAVRSSTPLKRPSSDALGDHSNHGRVDALRARTSINTFGDKRVDRLTLPHTGPSVAQQKGTVQSISSQTRTIRTVSRFFLSSVPAKKKDETPPATQENASIDRLLLAQKDRHTDKVLQGIKAKLGMDKPAKSIQQPFLNELNTKANLARRPLQSLSSNKNASLSKNSNKLSPMKATQSRHEASQKSTQNSQTKQTNLLERYGYHATS